MEIYTPITQDDIQKLHVGDTIYITGVIYTGRDQAHKKITEMLNRGESLPFRLETNVIYYTGPSPTKPGDIVGSSGPTSGYRMDAYAEAFIDLGFNVMIGKGPRSDSFKSLLPVKRALYLSAVGGAAALISQTIKKSEIIAFLELGSEAIYRYEVERFPVVVTYDVHGKDLFTEGINKYKK
ncbi:MAG: FumA C-terminus/TtdB family hydratase beta subunit [Acholeplasmataceae bacterium]|nr:FumA C-terminus/TtdB family hydratase beta subunit [Acholeplasmataceae bacterium]